MTITRYFNLNLNAGQSSPLTINVNQYDSGEQWIFTLYGDNGLKFTPATGAIVGVKSDGLGIINTGTVDSDGRVVINETQQMTAAAGRAVFELMLDSQTHGTANFVVLVEPKPGDHADLSDSDVSLIQQAIDSTIPENIAGAVSDWMDDNLAPSQWVLDSSLSVQGAAADAKAAGDKIDRYITLIDVVPTNEYPYIKFKQTYTDGSLSEVNVAANSTMVAVNNKIGNLLNLQTTAKNNVVSAINELNSNGLSNEVKQALLNCFNHVAWKDNDPNARQYINALQNALYPPANLLYITAVYTQSGIVYDTASLNDLKSDLVVTANYDNGTTSTVTTYTLSGTLTEGTSTISVTYGGKSTTFNVTVTAEIPTGYTWLYKASDGVKLSARTDIVTPTNSNATETLNDGNLNIYIPQTTGASKYIRYDLKQTTNTKAKLRAKFRINDMSIPTASSPPKETSAYGFRLQLSNGTNGTVFYQNYLGTNMKLVTYAGNTFTDIENIEFNKWYIIEVERNNSQFVIRLNDEVIYEATTASTYYTTANRIQVQNSASDATGHNTDIDVAWIAYTNND